MDIRNLRVREEVESERFEPAVDLGDVAKGDAPGFVQNPAMFFERTYLTESMRSLIIKSMMNLLGLRREVVHGKTYEVNSNLILLPSDLGGGKTHAMILLYHIYTLIVGSGSSEEALENIRILDEAVAEFVSKHFSALKEVAPKVVVIDCKYSDFAPSPVEPIKVGGKEIKTLWGYLGYELGKYDVVREADERKTAPYADVIFEMLNGSGAVILIDEIGRYYDQSGLEPTKISAFLMNLAEAMSKYTAKEVAVIVSVPYEEAGGRAEAKAGMEYVHSVELVRAVNEVLNRPSVEIIKPIGRQDLAEILRKRIFDHSEEDFEKFVTDFLSREIANTYPDQVRKVLESRNFWKAVRASYPFHPSFPEILEKLAYKLPHLQRTRDAIKIAVQTVLAIKKGLFDTLDKEIPLIMPYHIPIFVEEVLDETILRSATKEYKVFQIILRENVAKLEKLGNLAREGRTLADVMADPLRDLEEDRSLGFKLASIIWLHSLVGLGLPMNVGDFPTTADLIYSVSPTDLDVKGVLGILRSRLAQLVVSMRGDREDLARWFFTSIPSVDELINIRKRDVTDEMAKDKLTELLEQGITGKKGKPGKKPSGFKAKKSVIFGGRVKVVKSGENIPSEILESRDPALVVFADFVTEENLKNLLKGRNHVVVMAPGIEKLDAGERISPEDIKGIRELARFQNRTVWEGLLEILRYYVATENISEEDVRSLVGENTDLRWENEQAAKDVIRLLKEKVDAKKNYYYRNSWILINKNFRKVYYLRLGKLKWEDGLVLETDSPLPYVVEKFLEDKRLIPSEFRKEDLLGILENYLGINTKKDPIKVGNVWSFIRTTDKADVPLIAYGMFVGAVRDLVKTGDYAARVGGLLIWKRIYKDREEAKRIKDEGEQILKEVENQMKRLKLSWEDVELIYWENIFDGWVQQVLRDVPKGMSVRLLDLSGEVTDVNDVLEGFDPRNTIKAGHLFYQRKEYAVEIRTKLPEEIWEGKEYGGTIEVHVENFDDRIRVNIAPDDGLTIEPTSGFEGIPPVVCNLRLRAQKAGDYRICVEVCGKGKTLERRTLSISVRGEWKEREITGNDIEKVKSEEDVRVISLEAYDIQGLNEIQRIVRAKGGKIEGRVALEAEGTEVAMNVKTTNPQVLDILRATANSLRTIGDLAISVRLEFEKAPEIGELTKYLVGDVSKMRFRIKERATVGKEE